MTPTDTPARAGLPALTLAAIGVVYGDIGTSPLYTLKEIFSPAVGVPLQPAELVGAVSCILWALMAVVTLKYVLLILRADNQGEGGVLALTALAAQAAPASPRARRGLLLLGVFGATLFYGDSLITPAISVLGAMEGLQVAAPQLGPLVVPATLVILAGLFAVQRLGTAAVGRWFGPVIVAWFAMLAASGLWQVMQQPAILAALDPRHAAAFLATRGPGLLLAVGAIVLAVTGVEALYADMGHFGARPIRIAWTGLVLPALALNYLGQGALLMRDPTALENPFFRLFPSELIWPALGLATLAAIIASQAVISGAYSLTRQAIQLGFLPRMTVRHTSAGEAGQIYMPGVNTLLLVGVLAAVLAFRSSGALAGAYGIAVTLTMAITTLLFAVVAWRQWGLPLPLVAGGAAALLALDGLMVAGCAAKLLDGGWFPLAMGAALFVLMGTWWQGRQVALAAVRAEGLVLTDFVAMLPQQGLARVDRTAVYAVADPEMVPQALLHNLKHNQVLHRRNLIVSVRFATRPVVPDAERASVEPMAEGFWRVLLHFGFMETPDVPRALQRCTELGIEPLSTTYFLSRETFVPTGRAGMARWRERLFATLAHNAGSVAAFFRLPDNAVVELGTRVQI
ncbi:MAG: potassium transporter Kup [Rubrivivax sp.]